MLPIRRLLSAGPRVRFALAAFLAAFATFAQAAAQGSTTLVISQAYGGGGSTAALYSADFVEIFNRSSSPQSLNGLAIQYISSAGTSASSSGLFPLPNVTLAPGQRFLLTGKGTCSATGCITLPTGDLDQTSLAASGTAGRLYLTSIATALTQATPACPTTGIIDYIGYGSGVGCFEGTAAPATTTTKVDVRNDACVDTDNNGADFSALDPGVVPPRTMSSPATPCGNSSGPGAPSVTGTASPSSVYEGTATLLTASVSPGTNPASTGITVTADLSTYGGSSSQTLYDDGTNGDAHAGDGIYSYNFTMPANAKLGAGTITVKVTDSQTRSASANISLTVLAPVTLVPIHTIQGSTPGTSAYNGQTVMTSGIVTSIRANGFYLQSRDADIDADPNTPEGIFIHTGTGAVPSQATVGTYLQVTGTVSLYPAASTIPGTELDSPTAYTVLASSQALPAAITLTTTNPSPSGGFSQLQRLQGMRVSVPSLTVTGPTEGVLTETAETYVSDGIFWGTVTGVARPVREPGLEVLDPFTTGQPNTIPRFDDNPELLRLDSLSATPSPGALDLTSGVILSGVTGVMDLSNPPSDGSTYVPTLVIDATTRPTATANAVGQPVPVALANQITIGDQNFERLYNDKSDTTGATVVTTAAYQLRLSKASLAIRNILRSPDILCMEEIENIDVLNDLVARISSDANAAGQTDPGYTPYLVQGNDTSGINVAFLVKQSKITVTDVSQFGKSTTFTQPSTGKAATLNDRPSLVLTAGIKRPGMADYPVTVIVNHLKSLNNVTDTTGTGQNTRAKREQQAEFLANLVQGYQAAGKHVVVVGDMNAFEFNDGIVDTMDIVRGIVTSTNQDVVPGPSIALVNPTLVDLGPTNLANNMYNYSYVGNAQSIAHFFVTTDIASQMTLAPAHYNADFPVVYRNDATRPEVGSDHDGQVGYLTVPGFTVLTINPTTVTFAAQTLNTTTTQNVTITNSGSSAITVTRAAITGSTAFTVPANPCGGSIAAGSTCTLTVSFKPTVSGVANGTLTLTDSDVTGTQTVTLTGTGAGVFSTTSLLVSPTISVQGGSVTMQATVGSSGAAGTLSGTVSFLDGSTTLKSGVALTGGVATFTTTSLAIGSHSITAVYSGDSVFPTSTSAPVTLTVNAPPTPDFTLTLANTQIIIPKNVPSSTTVINVGMQNGYSQTVSFACSGLPANTTCSFSPATLSATGSTTLTIRINGMTSELRTPFGGGMGALAASLLLLPLMARRKTRLAVRRAAGAMMLLLLLVGVGAVTGCGGGSSATTPAGSSTVTVTATGGSVTHSATVTVVVQ